MESMADVLNKPELRKLMKMELTSEICDQHELRIKKPVYKIEYKGEIVCPVCERDRVSKEQSALEDEKIEKAFGNQKYNTLNASSVLSDKGLWDSTFNSYADKGEETVKNKKRATTAMEQYRKGEVFNTLITGDPGTGKSHLGMSILRNLNEKDGKKRSCLFISIPDVLLVIRESYKNKESPFTEHYFIDLMQKVDFLVLDDVGAETGSTDTDKTASDFTMRVLTAASNGRQNKSTILTTNLSREGLTRMYDGRLVSRLLKNSYVILFEDSDDDRVKSIEFEEDE